jgi:hypothetical protein
LPGRACWPAQRGPELGQLDAASKYPADRDGCQQRGADGEEAEDGPDSLVSFGAGFESVLDALRPLLSTWPLTWHYRSRDEPLVAFPTPTSTAAR